MRKRFKQAYVPTPLGVAAVRDITAVRIRLGPAPCRACGSLLYWRGPLGWTERSQAHDCEPANRAMR
jgi:hypothetical protein